MHPFIYIYSGGHYLERHLDNALFFFISVSMFGIAVNPHT